MTTVNNEQYRDYVMEIQRFLRTLSYYDDRIPLVSVDGIYDDKTAAAIKIFQSNSGLNATGEVDNQTFDELLYAYKKAEKKSSSPIAINGFTDKNKIIKPGDRCLEILLLQIMFRELSNRFDNIDNVNLSGIYDEQTIVVMKELKKRTKVDGDDNIDKRTWDEVARLFNNTHYKL